MSTDKRTELDSFLAEIFREGPPIPTNVSLLPLNYSDDAPAVDPPAGDAASSDAPADRTNTPSAEEIATTMAAQAKSVLAGLNRDTAIQLRWAMRDIKAKRTKLSPVDPKELAALIDLGFVEMHDETPMLTNIGFLALD
jgi:hypothetical protein